MIGQYYLWRAVNEDGENDNTLFLAFGAFLKNITTFVKNNFPVTKKNHFRMVIYFIVLKSD